MQLRGKSGLRGQSAHLQHSDGDRVFKLKTVEGTGTLGTDTISQTYVPSFFAAKVKMRDFGSNSPHHSIVCNTSVFPRTWDV